MNSDHSQIYKQAKDCHSKRSWEELFAKFGSQIQTMNSSKTVAELFKLLKTDPQALNYDPWIWEVLLEGCLSSWNLELGSEIASYVSKTPAPKIALASAKVHVEAGHPLLARNTANRALRLTGLSPLQKLQFEMVICQTYVDEGKRAMAIRLLNKMQSTVRTADLTLQDQGQFLANIARTNFFLGRYPQAGEQFRDAYEAYEKIENWYEAARSIYNSGSSYFSAGGKHQERAYAYVEECRRLSETHDLTGPLSHVEAFYGHDDYWHGNFAGARERYRRAYKHIPTSDQSYRTLHVLSMLAFIYLRTGQFGLAKKFGDKTLELSKRDESERFRSRYHNLRAELLWESGDIQGSQEFLATHASKLVTRGVNTLEELSTMSRYFIQCAQLREDIQPAKIKLNEQLKKNTGDWLEFLNAKGQLQLSQGHFEASGKTFRECRQKAKQYSDKYHYALGILGLLQNQLARNEIGASTARNLQELEIALARMVETPVKTHLGFVRAGIAYRNGEFEKVRYHLENLRGHTRMHVSDRFILESWLATMDGKSVRLQHAWQRDLLAHWTRVYFAPSLVPCGEARFRISAHYELDLGRHPSIAQLLVFLLQKNRFKADAKTIQTEVWKQSLAQSGWQQKIRNTIMRLRNMAPFTMAPLLIHNEMIELYVDAIAFDAVQYDHNPKEEILRLLREGPMSTVLLSNRLKVSSATTKRILKRLADEDKITVMKVGRKVLYQSIGSTD